MKPKFLLCLALVLSACWFASGLGTNNLWRGFPILPPVADANPDIRHPVSIQLPTWLKIERTADTLSVAIDSSYPSKPVTLMVGTNMIIGFENKLYVYPFGEPRPTNCNIMELDGGGLHFSSGTVYWHTASDGIPRRGTDYVVEADLAVFETDIPPQHDWEPQDTHYKVLFQRTLKQMVEGSPHIEQIHMLNARSGWAWADGVDGSNLLWHTANGGRTWRDITPRAFPFITEGSCFLNSQNAWVSTLDRKGYVGGLLHTTDGGKSWSVLVKAGAASYGCFSERTDCRFFNANDGVANTCDGSAGMSWVRFYETHNGGKDWKPLDIIAPGATPSSNEPPAEIGLGDFTPEKIAYCPPAKVVITHGDMDDETPKDGVHLSVTTNLEKTWRDLKLPLPSEKYRDGLVECDTPVFLDGKNGWLPAHIVKYNPNNATYTFAWNVLAFYATHDGGKTWAARSGVIEGNTNLVGFYGQVDIVSARDIFVCSGPHLYVTHDGAKSWRIITPNLDFDRTSSHGGVLQIDFVDSTHGWAVLYDTFNDFHGEKFYLYKTTNGGKTWAELPLRISQ